MDERGLKVDAVIIGGGFYGASIAIYLAKSRGLTKVILIEKEEELLKRASYNNQARVHNGYHYPRSFTTAFRSRVNLPRFVKDWPHVVKNDFTKIYGIARNNSKVTAKQFERFCYEIGARLEPLPASMVNLFEPRLIEKAFLVQEYAFDTIKLAQLMIKELREAGVKVYFKAKVESVFHSCDGKSLTVAIEESDNTPSSITCRYVFNCTYSGLNQLAGDFSGIRVGLKQEITEMALMELPDSLKDIGITIMDGPFFSIMPFPARGVHTLSHVRYTPHFSWTDEQGVDPYTKLDQYDKATRVHRMVRDVTRYIPSVKDAIYKGSLFEVKTVLLKNEGDDGRPILFEKNQILSGFYSILGGKIDNIYDVIEKLETEKFSPLEE